MELQDTNNPVILACYHRIYLGESINIHRRVQDKGDERDKQDKTGAEDRKTNLATEK